jgi:glycosyltransferase involved in cell wall biosynthesis
MKILIVVDTMGTGGKERRLLELLKGLMAYDQIDCALVILSDIVEYRELSQVSYPIYHIRRSRRIDLSVYKRLYQIVRQFEPDILQSWSSFVSLYVFPIARLLRIKFVNAMIADAPADLKVFSARWIRSRLSFPFSDAVIANSQAGLIAYNAPRNRSYCIHNGIDLKRFYHLKDDNVIRKKLGITTSYVVGMVGSFRGAKDYGTYLAAAKQVLAVRNDITFLAIGDGKDLPVHQKDIEDRFKDYIIFTGRQEDVESIVHLFTIGVLITDSSVHGEGISNAIIEYMVLGKPVIATDTGGTTELLMDGITGIITPQRNPQKLAENMQYLLNNKDIAEQMGRRGKERVLEHFSLYEMTKKFVDLYGKLLSESQNVPTNHAIPSG